MAEMTKNLRKAILGETGFKEGKISEGEGNALEWEASGQIQDQNGSSRDLRA